MKTSVLLITCLLAVGFLGKAQVKIGSQGPSDPSAILELESTNRGFLLPRLTTAQRNAIQNPATGLMVFDTDLQRIYVKSSSQWDSLQIKGHEGPYVLKLNGTARNLTITDSIKVAGIKISRGSNPLDSNLVFGTNVLTNNYSGKNNLGIGTSILYSNVIGNRNIGIGQEILTTNTSGNDNMGIGYQALKLSTGSRNIGVGTRALNQSNTASDNIAMGFEAGRSITTGSRNTILGVNSFMANATGDQNVAVGYNVMPIHQSGSNNVAMGNQAGLVFNSGSNNTFVGANAANQFVRGDGNLGIGRSGNFLNNTGSNQLFIADAIHGQEINDTTRVRIGIGTKNPHNSAILELSSTDKGFLPPRMTKNQRIAIANPALGLMVFDTDDNRLYFRSNTGWDSLHTRPPSAILNQFLLINQGIASKLTVVDSLHVNGLHVGRGSASNTQNLAFGQNVMKSIGSGNYNIGFGYSVLTANTSGQRNIGIGVGVLQNNSSGSQNIALGNSSLNANTSGSNNIALGYQTLWRNQGGSNNLILGNNAAPNAITGNNNIAYGHGTLPNLTSGSENIALGNNAGANITTQSGNIMIGNNTGIPAGSTANNQLNIGNVLFAQSIESEDYFRMGIGTSNIDNNAILELKSETKGLLLPRGNVNRVVNYNGNLPAGLLFYDATSNKLLLRTNTRWDTLNHSTGQLITKINGIGSNLTITDSLKVGSMKISRGPGNFYGNIAIGTNTFKYHSNTLVEGNDRIGLNNVAIGDSAMLNDVNGYQNTVIGTRALRSNTIGANNTAIGYNALENLNGTGKNADDTPNNSNRNVAIGMGAASSLISGNNNIAIGFNAQLKNANANQQLAIGSSIYANNIYNPASLNMSLGAVDPDPSFMLNVSGSIRASGFTTSSDQRLKTNIKDLNLGLEIIKTLQPKSYFWNKSIPMVANNSPQEQFGFLAQDLEKTLPNLVQTGNDAAHYKSIDYQELIPVLTKAIQDQQKIIEALKKKIEALENR